MTRIFVALIFIAFCRPASNAQERRPSFGERQLEQLMDDRPSMQHVIPVGHSIRGWVVERFEQGALGDRVYWDHHEPIEGAEHVDSKPALLRITRDERVTGRDKWTMLIFELINFERGMRRRELHSKALHGEIGRAEFVLEKMRLEVDALRQTQDFFRRHPIPGSVRGTDTFYFGLLSTNTEFDAYLRFLDSRDADEYNPLTYFGEEYEEMRARGGRQSRTMR